MNAVHLGSVIGYGASKIRIEKSINEMLAQTNTISKLFSKADTEVKYKLFKCYCMSYYGCPLWDLSDKVMSDVYVTWRKCIRKLYNLPLRTHCDLLPLICRDIPVQLQLYKRFCKFIHVALNSQNCIVKRCALLALNGSCSCSGNNINLVSNSLHVSKFALYNNSLNNIFKAIDDLYHPNVNTEIDAQRVRDLIYLTSNTYANFSRSDFITMLNYVCCQ